jgi:hypothetical protein
LGPLDENGEWADSPLEGQTVDLIHLPEKSKIAGPGTDVDQNGNFIGKRYTFETPIGVSPGGYDQNSVFVHWSPTKGIHGVPTTVGGG